MNVDETNSKRIILPMTKAQQSIWYDATQKENPENHTMGDWMDFRGNIDEEPLEQYLIQTIQEVEAARCVYRLVDGIPVQEVLEEVNFKINHIDLRASTEHERISEAQNDMTMRLAHEFDVDTPPLVEAIFYRISPTRLFVLLLMHHLVCDGYSRNTLYERWRQLVTDDTLGEPLPSLTTLIDAESNYYESRALSKDREYWRNIAGKLPDFLTLSTGYTGISNNKVSRENRKLSTDIVKKLDKLAGDSGVSRAVCLIALTALHIAHCTGTDIPVITVPFTARTSEVTRRTPGMVANYLPFMVSIFPEDSLTDFISRVGRDLFRMTVHQRFRVEEIRRMSGISLTDHRPYGPYVNVIPQQQVYNFGRSVAFLNNLSTGAVSDLMITWLDQSDESIMLHVDGNLSLYTSLDISNIADGLTDLICLAVQDTSCVVGSLAIRNNVGINQDVSANYRPSYDPVKRILDYALRAPTEPAIVTATSDRMSRGELVSSAHIFASSLKKAESVCLLANPGCDAITAILGSLIANSPWTPLDPVQPHERLNMIIEDTECKVLAVESELYELAMQLINGMDNAPEVVVIPRSTVYDMSTLADSILGKVDFESVPYVLYTSGTTGKPKGAMGVRRGLANHLDAKIRLLELTDNDVVIQNSPLTFDVSIWQILAPLCVGGVVLPVNRAVAADPDALAKLAHKYNVTHLEVVPSFLKNALSLWTHKKSALPQGLKTIMVTGEAVPTSLVEDWFHYRPDIPMINAYGPTECSDDITHAVLFSSTDIATRVPIGTAVQGADLLVLGPDLGDVPDGHPGELFVGGTCVGNGYLGNPVRTASAFVARPGRSGEVMYRTGDIVIRRPNGSFEFIERVDNQVKVNGQRIELGEVETMVRRVPDISAVACTILNLEKQTRLVAHIVLAENNALPQNHTELTSYLMNTVSQWAPQHVIPTVWDVVSELPLTSHGKVDRKALTNRVQDLYMLDNISNPKEFKELKQEQEVLEENYGQLAAIITRIMAEVIGASNDFYEDSDFFRSGGDSISALQVVSQLSGYGYEIRPVDIFESPTPVLLAEHIMKDSAESSLASKFSNETQFKNDMVSYYGLSSIQQDLVYDAKFDIEAISSYSQYVYMVLPLGMSVADINEAMDSIACAHSSLRQIYNIYENNMINARTRDIGLYGWCSEGDKKCSPYELAKELSLSKGILWRGYLCNSTLLLVIHHMVIDGVSWRIIQEDLQSWWNNGERNGVVNYENTSWGEWIHNAMFAANESDLVAKEYEYWNNIINKEYLNWPSEGSNLASRSNQYIEKIDDLDILKMLKSLPQDLKIHIDDVFLLAMSYALSHIKDNLHCEKGECDEFIIEMEGHGRNLPGKHSYDVSRTLGWFTSLYPMAVPTVNIKSGYGDLQDGLLKVLDRLVAQRLAVDTHGSGFGILLRLNSQVSKIWEGYNTPSIGFNFLGRFISENSEFSFLTRGIDGEYGNVIGTIPGNGMVMRHPLEITCSLVSNKGQERLITEFCWDGGSVEENIVYYLARAWKDGLKVIAEYADILISAFNERPQLVEGIKLCELESWLSTGVISKYDEIVPLQSMQRGMAVQSFAATSNNQEDPYVLQIVGWLDCLPSEGALQEAINSVLEASPALGLTILQASGGPIGVLRSTRINVHTANGAGSWENVAFEERSRPFDTTKGPLVRCTRVADSESQGGYIIWTMHHILADGWSLAIVLGDIIAVLSGETAPKHPLPSLVTENSENTDWWHKYLHGAEATFSGGGVWSQNNGEKLSYEVPLHDNALEKIAQYYSVTPATILSAVWGGMLCALTNKRDVLFGTVTASRYDLKEEGPEPIGNNLVTLPTRFNIKGNESIQDLLKRLQNEASRSREYGKVSISHMLSGNSKLREWVEPFDSAVVIENFPQFKQRGKYNIQPIYIHDQRHYPLSLVAVPHDEGGWTIRIDYASSADLGDFTIESLVEKLVGIIHDLSKSQIDDLAVDTLNLAYLCQPIPANVLSESCESDNDSQLVELVAKISGEVLNIESLGYDTSFFLAGGDSVTAIYLVNRMAELGYTLSVQDIFEHRNPRNIASSLKVSDNKNTNSSLSSSSADTVSFKDIDNIDRELGF